MESKAHFYYSYVLVIGICTSALFSVLIPISENSALTLNDLNAGTGYLVRSLSLTSDSQCRPDNNYSF